MPGHEIGNAGLIREQLKCCSKSISLRLRNRFKIDLSGNFSSLEKCSTVKPNSAMINTM